MVQHLAKKGLISFRRGGEDFVMHVAGMQGGELAGWMRLARTFASGAGTKRFESMLVGGSINRPGATGGSWSSGTHGMPGGGTFRGTTGTPGAVPPTTNSTALVPGGGPALPATTGSTAMTLWKPKAYQARIIRAGADPDSAWNTGYGSAAVVGGMLGAMTADPDQRLRGAIMGAGGGMMVGKGFRAFSRKGAGISNSVYTGIDNKIGANAAWGPMNRAWNKHKTVVHKGLRGFHSTQGRHNMFRSGAMLGGAGFGAMFASNGRSHKRGFNAQRGNSFSR